MADAPRDPLAALLGRVADEIAMDGSLPTWPDTDQRSFALGVGVGAGEMRDRLPARLATLDATHPSGDEALDSLEAIREKWEIEPGDKHHVSGRYADDSWWIENQRGDSLHVNPDDIIAIFDAAALATPSSAPDERIDLGQQEISNEAGRRAVAEQRAIDASSAPDVEGLTPARLQAVMLDQGWDAFDIEEIDKIVAALRDSRS